MPATSPAPRSLPPVEVAARVETSSRTRPSLSSSTAPPARARCAPRPARVSWATRTSTRLPAALAAGRPKVGRGSCPSNTPSIATNPRYARHLVMPEVGPEGQAQAAAGEGAVHRRRWAWARRPCCISPPRASARSASSTSTSVDLSQPAAPGRPRREPHRHEEDRVGGDDDQGAQPGGQGRPARRDADRRQRRSAHRRLRPCHRRHGHVRDALHAQRRGRSRGNPRRARLGVPLRGAADRLRAVRGPVLPLPLPDSPAARARARLLRRRRAGRRAGRDGPAPGDRGDQAAPQAWAIRSSAGC